MTPSAKSEDLPKVIELPSFVPVITRLFLTSSLIVTVDVAFVVTLTEASASRARLSLPVFGGRRRALAEGLPESSRMLLQEGRKTNARAVKPNKSICFIFIVLYYNKRLSYKLLNEFALPHNYYYILYSY